MAEVRKSNPSCAGKSLLELLWDELLKAMGPIMPGGDLADVLDPESGGYDSDLHCDRWMKAGECIGLASALALFINPYNPSIDAVRVEAVERWEARQAA